MPTITRRGIGCLVVMAMVALLVSGYAQTSQTWERTNTNPQRARTHDR
jgi:hypothetical protein